MARGSILETVDHLGVALDEAYTDEKLSASLISDCRELTKILNGYIAYLKKRKDPPEEES